MHSAKAEHSLLLPPHKTSGNLSLWDCFSDAHTNMGTQELDHKKLTRIHCNHELQFLSKLTKVYRPKKTNMKKVTEPAFVDQND